jgi:hypothetical protein
MHHFLVHLFVHVPLEELKWLNITISLRSIFEDLVEGKIG